MRDMGLIFRLLNRISKYFISKKMYLWYWSEIWVVNYLVQNCLLFCSSLSSKNHGTIKFSGFIVYIIFLSEIDFDSK